MNCPVMNFLTQKLSNLIKNIIVLQEQLENKKCYEIQTEVIFFYLKVLLFFSYSKLSNLNLMVKD